MLDNMHCCSVKLKEFRKILKVKDIYGTVIPSNDEFLSEYCPPHARRLEWLTGFSGSAGVAVITQKQAAFFTDGRYILQADKQLSSDYEKYNISDLKPYDWIKNNSLIKEIVIDPKLHSYHNAKAYLDTSKISIIDYNLVDLIWKDRPEFPTNCIYKLADKYTGENFTDKIKTVVNTLQEKNADACVITSPDSICWLLNIRSDDISTSPIILANAIVTKEAVVKLFIDKKRIDNKILSYFADHVEIISDINIYDFLRNFNVRLLIDPQMASYAFFDIIKTENAIKSADPCLLPKACKNKKEIQGIKQAHIIDGAALTKFLYWLNNNIAKQNITEMSAADKLLAFRSESKDFKTMSFDTIAGFAQNGAIIHYRAEESSNKAIKPNGLFLLDSGGQYYNGTTDVTRTIAIGKATKEQRQNYTRVLKGHIALASAIFPKGTTGSQLDILARQYLWQSGLDYDHGTGHGVGCFLNVHEGPQRISKMPNDIALQVGMVISNEPGYYKKDSYGIRIENLVVVVSREDVAKGYLGFDTITRVAFDNNLIQRDMMTDFELEWIKSYNKKVISDLSSYLDENEKIWLLKICKL
jgi:Xaa-Pro aminopeptidase